MLEGIWCNFLIDLENSALTDVASVLFVLFLLELHPLTFFSITQRLIFTLHSAFQTHLLFIAACTRFFFCRRFEKVENLFFVGDRILTVSQHEKTCSSRFVWQDTIRADDLHNASVRFTDFARGDARTMWGAGGETFPVLLVCGERWWARSGSVSLSQRRWRSGRERKTPRKTGTTPSSTDRENKSV